MVKKILQLIVPATITWALTDAGDGGSAHRVWMWQLYTDGTFTGMVDGFAPDLGRALVAVDSWDQVFFIGYTEVCTQREADGIARDLAYIVQERLMASRSSRAE
jgi:hypothetical protein